MAKQDSDKGKNKGTVKGHRRSAPSGEASKKGAAGIKGARTGGRPKKGNS